MRLRHVEKRAVIDLGDQELEVSKEEWEALEKACAIATYAAGGNVPGGRRGAPTYRIPSWEELLKLNSVSVKHQGSTA